MGHWRKPSRGSLAAFAAPAAFFLAGCAHAAGAEPTDADEPPIVGWSCSEYQRLPDAMRAALLAPVIEVAAPGGSPAPPLAYEFALYRDDPLGGTVESYASWLGVTEALRGNSPDVLYFTLRGRLADGDRLVFKAGGGTQIRLPADVPITVYLNSGRPEATVKLTDRALAARLLQHPAYEVFAERANALIHVARLQLFSPEQAVASHAALLARMKTKIADPATHCTPVPAPEPAEDSII